MSSNARSVKGPCSPHTSHTTLPRAPDPNLPAPARWSRTRGHLRVAPCLARQGKWLPRAREPEDQRLSMAKPPARPPAHGRNHGRTHTSRTPFRGPETCQSVSSLSVFPPLQFASASSRRPSPPSTAALLDPAHLAHTACRLLAVLSGRPAIEARPVSWSRLERVCCSPLGIASVTAPASGLRRRSRSSRYLIPLPALVPLPSISRSVCRAVLPFGHGSRHRDAAPARHIPTMSSPAAGCSTWPGPAFSLPLT